MAIQQTRMGCLGARPVQAYKDKIEQDQDLSMSVKNIDGQLV